MAQIAGSRLKSFVDEWKARGAHGNLLSILSSGYSIPIREDRPLRLVLPAPHMETRMKVPEHQDLIRIEVQTLKEKGAIRQVLGDKWGFYSKIFLGSFNPDSLIFLC